MEVDLDLFEMATHERLLKKISGNLEKILKFGGATDKNIREYFKTKLSDERQPFAAGPTLHWKKGMKRTEDKLLQFILIPIGQATGLCEVQRYRLLKEVSERFAVRHPPS